jgi:hypothetical protein
MLLTKKFNKFKRDNTIKFLKLFSDEKAFKYYRNYVKKNTILQEPDPYLLDDQVREMLDEGLDPKIVHEYIGLFNVLKEVTSVQLFRSAEDVPDNPNNENDPAYFMLRYKNADEGLTVEVVKEEIDESEFTVQPFKDYGNPDIIARASVKNILEDLFKTSLGQDSHTEVANRGTLPIHFNIAGNKIAMASKRGAGNVIVTSPENAEFLLRNIYDDKQYSIVTRNVGRHKRKDTPQLSYEFTINGTIRVYSSQLYDYVRTEYKDDADYLMLYNGSTNIDSGFFVYIAALAEENEYKQKYYKYVIKPIVPDESCDYSRPENYMAIISK